MTNVTAVISTVITLFIMLAVGYTARKTGILAPESSKHLSQLIICVGQPFMIIGALLGVERTGDNIKTGLYILALGAAAHIVISVIAYIAAKRIKGEDERKLSEFAIIFANCGFMGFPLLQAVFGGIGIFWGSFYIIVFNIFTWTWGMRVLLRGSGEKLTFLTVLRKSVVNYGTLPCIIGFLIFILDIPIPDSVSNAFSYIGGICTPVSMVITGGLLSTISFRHIFTDKRIYFVTLMKLIVIPAAIGGLAYICGLSDEMIIFVTIMSAMPTAANTVMFAELYGITPGYAAATVGFTTLLSTATLPLVMWAATALTSL